MTPLENYLRKRSGLSPYQGDFGEHYVLPLLYPTHLTRAVQIWLSTAALIINILLYWHIIRMQCRPGSG